MTTAGVMSSATAAGRSHVAGRCGQVVSYRLSLSWYLLGSWRWWNPLKGHSPALVSCRNRIWSCSTFRCLPFSEWPVSRVFEGRWLRAKPPRCDVLQVSLSFALCFNACFLRILLGVAGLYVRTVLGKGLIIKPVLKRGSPATYTTSWICEHF